MGKLKSIEELFAGRHFDREVISFASAVPALINNCSRAA